MKKNMTGLMIGFIILSMYGCSTTQYPITYNSNPHGASVVCDGVNLGYTPTTLYYEPDQKNMDKGTMQTTSCTAHWISGAKKDYGNTWNLKKFPDGVMQTVQRPEVEGYEKDVQFELQVQQMQYLRQRLETERYLERREQEREEAEYRENQKMIYQLQDILEKVLD